MSETRIELRTALVAHTRMQLATLDYRRAIKQLSAEGHPQTVIARMVGVSQPAIAQSLRRSRDLTGPVEGFAGASPYEIIQRFIAGQIDRDEAIAQLARWDYPRAVLTDGEDDLSFDEPGGWGEVELACDQGLIDDDFIDEVQDEQERLGRA